MHYKLTEEIILLSNSKYWDSAKLEWFFRLTYISEEQQRCLCGHFPIREICVIKNSKNGNEAEVGNCCVNKFLDIDDANKILTSVKRVKEDNSKTMSKEALEYLFKNNAINDFEYKFYLSLGKKRNLSSKQLVIKERINDKLSSFTSYELNSSFNKINKVLQWAESNPSFDISFVKSLKESCTRKGKLTEKQNAALNSIINKWKIE
ncbi:MULTISPECIES: hypothetical protein [Myroides]|uniref:hypothetical protein n=1 Tax=Myroides TaxID=76831 RepID=UPI0025770DD2|nr:MULTISPECIES: hypothetical protein [Myroides]